VGRRVPAQPPQDRPNIAPLADAKIDMAASEDAYFLLAITVTIADTDWVYVLGKQPLRTAAVWPQL